MVKCAYIFQNDNLIIPCDFNDSQIEKGVPLERIAGFTQPETFEIFSVDDSPPSIITVVSIPAQEALPDNWKSINFRRIIALLCTCGAASGTGETNMAKMFRACHIEQWRRASRFCGTCGAKNNEVSREGYRSCPVCGCLEFPRICPAVITMVTDNENRILLAHNKRFKAGIYSHISGFNEAGETLEETVAREIHEEAGIRVSGIEYIKSQPWPLPNSLMIGFKARYLSGTIRPDGEEIDDVKWFTKDNLPGLPGEGSLSRLLINQWLAF